MNIDLQRVLSERADSVDPPQLDPLDVVAHGERLGQRRRRLTVAAVLASVALTLGTAALVEDRADVPPPPADRLIPVPQWSRGTRPLTYGVGQTLHLADREIDTGLDFLSIDLTDDGAALTTVDGGIWFTDGATVERIGTTLGVRRATRSSITFFVGRPREWVAGASAGSLLAWLEFPGHHVDRPELVVWDSRTRSVLAREPIEVADRNSATVLDVVGRVVFVAEDDRGSSNPTRLLRYNVDSGALEPVPDAEVVAARRGVARTLVVGSATDGALVHTPDRTMADNHSKQTLEVRDSGLDGLRDPRTGNPVEITVPSNYDDGSMWFTQWVDNDRFVLVTAAGMGELLVCRISAGRCEVAVEGFTWRATALTPGDGLRGSERALGRAIRTAAGP